MLGNIPCVILILLFFNLQVRCQEFNPNFEKFDDYGVRISANERICVQADNKYQAFTLHYSPFDHRYKPSECYFSYPDKRHFVYTLAVGAKDTGKNRPYLYFLGEVDLFDGMGRSGMFIRILHNANPLDISHYYQTNDTVPCNYIRSLKETFFNSLPHQEFMVLAVEPYGMYAFVFAKHFAFRYDASPTAPPITILNEVEAWTEHVPFYPCSADATDIFTIVAGFTFRSEDVQTAPVLRVLLLDNLDLKVMSSWSYRATANSWKSRLLFSKIDRWSSRFSMSVKVNLYNHRHVIVGMPLINTVFLLLVDPDTLVMTMTSSYDNGRSSGFGKAVSWIEPSMVAILANTYTLDYTMRLSSKLFIFPLTSHHIATSPMAVFPNLQQTRPTRLNEELIQMVSTPSMIIILDTNGWLLFMLPERAGYFAWTGSGVTFSESSFVFASVPKICSSGTHKMTAGVQPCSLCPSGTLNSGDDNNTAIVCPSCASELFCPLGASFQVQASLLQPLTQSYAYPQSPEFDVFEDILLNNMFLLGQTTHCLRVSPVFWCLILLGIVILFLLVISSMSLCIQRERHDYVYAIVQQAFQHTDLVVSREQG
jgi:hypothetical protein